MEKVVVKGVSKKYIRGKAEASSVEALRDVDLTVNEKEFLCIIGPSGCGKTTLLKIIDGLITPDKGEVFVDDELVSKPSPKMSMVFQQFNLLPWRTVLGNVAFGQELQGVPKERRNTNSMKYIELVGLGGFENHHPGELSGGMQQRVGLARALATGPEVLLMDEPFGSVDAQTRQILQDQLLDIWQTTKKTIIFVTHSMDEAAYLADRVVVMKCRPGCVKETIEVKAARPRLQNAEFLKTRNYLWQILKEEIVP